MTRARLHLSELRPGHYIRLVVAVLSVLSATTCAEQKTSKNDDRLANALRQFPEADANGDGVLTVAEANAYRQQLTGRQQGGRARRTSGAGEALTPTVKDFRYGPHERNVLDLYQAKSDQPTPVLIFFHGGGFVGGDKSIAATQKVCQQCLESGISVVGANYRFVRGKDGNPGEPFPAPMLDGARVIQFVRSKAAEWNLDPKRVALSGGSAGGCMSVWLALHDDLADPKSEDSVARLSTRVSAVVGYGAQTNLNPSEMLELIGGNPSIHPSLQPFFGVKSLDELNTPEKQKLVREASATNLATKDDPPLHLNYGGKLDDAPLPADTPTGVSIHHAMFGKVLQDRYKELGLTCHLRYQGVKNDPDEIAFLKTVFGMDGG